MYVCTICHHDGSGTPKNRAHLKEHILSNVHRASIINAQDNDLDNDQDDDEFSARLAGNGFEVVVGINQI